MNLSVRVLVCQRPGPIGVGSLEEGLDLSGRISQVIDVTFRVQG